MEHPDLQLLIQKSISEDRLRSAAMRQRSPSEPVARIRIVAGNALMAIGARIAASGSDTARTINPQPAAGTMSIAGSSRNV